MQVELTDGTPPESTYTCRVSGRIQTDIFTHWFRHFISVTKPTVDDPVSLILDGHYSHTRNLDVITLSRENNVSILCLPPHSSHKIQPLDLAFKKLLSLETWLLNNFPRIVTIRQVGKLFRNAYLRTATVETAVNGFRKSGIYPLNRNVFGTHDFALHAEEEDANSEQSGYEPTMFRNKQPTITELREPSDFQLSEASASNGSTEAPSDSPINVSDEPIASTSTTLTVSSSRLVLAASLSPLPSIIKQVINDVRPSRAGSAKIITACPYKAELEVKREV
jgi:hypothetical protein